MRDPAYVSPLSIILSLCCSLLLKEFNGLRVITVRALKFLTSESRSQWATSFARLAASSA